MIELFLPAFLVSVVLLGIHSYFGLEIIRRGIIFTDLAIGQMAALGTAIALLFFDGQHIYLVSLGFALTAGLLIGALSRREKNVEPLIGLLYALGISGVFLLLSRSAHGMEEIQNLMAYDILFTPMSEVLKTAGIYTVLGVLLWVNRRFLQGLWQELSFFLIFAATVTSSVKLAGVLVVFSLLVAPALLASYLPVHKHKLWWAWGLGTLINLGAMMLSFYLDLPTGYSVVFVQTLMALFVGVMSICLKRPLPVISENNAD